MSDPGLEPVLAGTSSAVQAARSRPSTYRPATIVDLTIDRAIAHVIDDHDPQGDPYGVAIICPTHLKIGDRVMIHYNPPHGSLLVGLLRGGYEPWTIFKNDGGGGLNGNIGYLGPGWTQATGSNYPDSNAYPIGMFRRRGGVVELRGRLTRQSGASNDIAWLPAGYWPRNNLLMTIITAPIAAAGSVIVWIDGHITLAVGTPDAGGGGFVQLDGISYSVE